MPNQYKNKVVYNGQTLIDLTADTVTPSTLMQGYTAHDASGAAIVGTATGGDEGSAYQDEDGYIVLGEGESSAPQGTLSITQNGSYDVAQYAAASVAVPVGMTEAQLKAYIQRDTTFTDIDWPDGMTRIGVYAFASCTYFNPSSLPSGVTIIDSHAFNSCTSLALTSLPSGVKSIGNYAFYSCSMLALTSLPSTVTSIGEYAFRFCTSITLTSLPSNITSIQYYAFAGCTSLALTSLPNSVTGVAGYGFQDCHNLAISSLPSGMTIINNNSFERCNGITSISCDGALTVLGSSAFLGNSSYPMALTSASFPNATSSVGVGTVFGSTTAANACQLLEFCDIGSTSSILSNAFANCYALETLVLRRTGSVCTLSNVSAFTNTPMSGYNNLTGTVYVPSALISSYKTATNWSTLYNNGTVDFVAIEGSDYELD